MFTPVRRKLHLYLSPLKMLSSPMAASKRLRGWMRGGFLSSFSVPGAGTFTRFDVSPEAGHGVGKGVVGVALILSHMRPACNSWSAVRPLRSIPGCPFGKVTDGPPLIGLHRLFGSVTL